MIKLRWRLFLLQIIIVPVVFSGIGIYIYYETQSSVIDSRARQAYEAVSWALTSSEPVGDIRVRDINEVAERLSYSPSGDFSFFLLGSDGQLLRDLSLGEPYYIDSLGLMPDLAGSIANGGNTMSVTRVAPGTSRTLVYVIPVYNDQNVLIGAVQSEVLLDEADHELSHLKTLLLLGFGGAFVIVTILWFLMTRSALRPLEDIASVSQNVADGNFQTRVKLPRLRDEVYRTAESYNAMLDHLQAAIAAEKKSQEQIRQLVADAAHELRSPLTVLKGYLDVLLRGAKDNPEDLQKSLENMQLTVGRTSRMANDLLTLSRLDAGVPLQMEALELKTLCDRIFEMAQVTALDKSLEFTCDGLIKVRGDSELLSRAIWNLLDNAIKHTPAGSKIVFSASRQGDECVISVTDNGEGITSGHLSRIFERFYRVRQRQSEGSGLGLAIARSVVEAHGGRLTVESTPGIATTFTIRLPLVPG
jgi:two-component system OmpR family sensor kinase